MSRQIKAIGNLVTASVRDRQCEMEQGRKKRPNSYNNRSCRRVAGWDRCCAVDGAFTMICLFPSREFAVAEAYGLPLACFSNMSPALPIFLPNGDGWKMFEKFGH